MLSNLIQLTTSKGSKAKLWMNHPYLDLPILIGIFCPALCVRWQPHQRPGQKHSSQICTDNDMWYGSVPMDCPWEHVTVRWRSGCGRPGRAGAGARVRGRGEMKRYVKWGYYNGKWERVKRYSTIRPRAIWTMIVRPMVIWPHDCSAHYYSAQGYSVHD